MRGCGRGFDYTEEMSNVVMQDEKKVNDVRHAAGDEMTELKIQIRPKTSAQHRSSCK